MGMLSAWPPVSALAQTIVKKLTTRPGVPVHFIDAKAANPAAMAVSKDIVDWIRRQPPAPAR